MSENPFGDLDETIADEDADDAGGAAETSSAEPEPESEPEDDPLETPAFPFDVTTQKPFYVREETWSAWSKAERLDVERVFVEADLEEVPKREKQDAILRLAADNPELVAEYVLEGRGIDVDDAE